MGYMKHNAVVVTSWDVEAIDAIHKKAIEIFDKKFEGSAFVRKGSLLVSPLIDGITNSQMSFLIAPDGSKEGWSDSDLAQEARDEFMNWAVQSGYYCDYIEIRFGGDDDDETILRSHDSDLKKLDE
jgi:hypothetical protein